MKDPGHQGEKAQVPVEEPQEEQLRSLGGTFLSAASKVPPAAIPHLEGLVKALIGKDLKAFALSSAEILKILAG